MTGRPGGRVVRTVVPIALCAALASAPLLGTSPVRAITPAEASAAGYVPNPAPSLANITISDVTPRVFDGAGSGGTEAVGSVAGVPTVTVTGTIVNVGDVALESADVRLQRGPRVTDADAVREPLVWSEPSFPVVGEFQRVAGPLAPGESAPYRVTMPARGVPGSAGADLRLTEPGVYPLLVNVNGTPEGGSPARLDDARTLLPVLDAPDPAGESLAPPDPAPPGAATTDDDDEVAPEPGPLPSPVPLTVLWPLAAPPTRVAHVPGADGADPVVALTDDSLLRSLSEEGRLTGLVRSAEEAFAGTGGQELRRATCLAVDPVLLGTVSEIADGRSVVIDGGRGPAAPGEADRSDSSADEVSAVDDEAVAADASRWLDQLRTLADSGCVVSLPAAQADLDAVSRVGDPALTDAALDRSGTVERVLGVAPMPDVVVPASGTLSPRSAGVAGEGASTAIVAAPSTRTDTGVVPPPGLVGLAGPDGDRALTYSAAVGSSLAATGSAPENPRYSDPDTRHWLTVSSPAARLQDARAALLAPIIDAAAADPAAADREQDGTGVLAVPPQVWSIDEASADSLLDTFGTQLSAGRMRAVPLSERLAAPVTTPEGSLAEEPTGAADPGATDPFAGDPAGTTEQQLRAPVAGVGTLRSLVDTSDPTSAGAAAHIDPLMGDALRVISETGRRADGDGVTLGAETGAAARVRTAARLDRLERTVAASLGRVDLLPPGSVFTMASPNSPLLLVARNALPFPVQISVDVHAPPALHVDPVGLIRVPASGSRTLQVPTQSQSDGGARHTVTFSLHGPDGRPLSEPVELSVHSGGYPLAQAFAVAAAALALVLGGRRYLRYRRGIHDPADEGHRP